MSVFHIKYKGEPHLLVGKSLEAGGGIATVEQYIHGVCGTGHLYPDGTIRAHGKVVGSRADIEFIGPADEIEPADDFMENMASHPSWGMPPLSGDYR
jgi:hypothetical protein